MTTSPIGIFLVDNGASYSIFPFEPTAQISNPKLPGPSGKQIPCWEKENYCAVLLQFMEAFYWWGLISPLLA
jgi:hypothetical protein